MTLYFENSNGERRIIATPKTEEDAMKENDYGQRYCNRYDKRTNLFE